MFSRQERQYYNPPTYGRVQQYQTNNYNYNYDYNSDYGQQNYQQNQNHCRVVQKLLLELSYWLMLISLGADVDVDLGPRPNQAKLPSFSFYPIHFIHCLNLNGMN